MSYTDSWAPLACEMGSVGWMGPVLGETLIQTGTQTSAGANATILPLEIPTRILSFIDQKKKIKNSHQPKWFKKKNHLGNIKIIAKALFSCIMPFSTANCNIALHGKWWAEPKGFGFIEIKHFYAIGNEKMVMVPQNGLISVNPCFHFENWFIRKFFNQL